MSKHSMPRRYRKKRSGSPLPLLLLMAAAILVLVAILVLPMGKAPWIDLPEEPSEPVTTTTTTATTTTSTTSATVTTTTTTAADTADRYIDDSGLLQFSTEGRYVQSASYAEGEQIPWNLMLVNDWNPLPKGYDDAISRATVGNQSVDARILDALQAMLEAGKEHGIGVQSAYRSVSRQNTLYWAQVDRQKNNASDDLEVQTLAGQIVKRPGYSEHHTGLAVDLGGNGNFRLEEDFEDTPAFAWLTEHCHEYGFILRFPKDKEAITGVIYEPWHYRYVGKEVAAEIKESGLCLEEYLQQQGQ